MSQRYYDWTRTQAAVGGAMHQRALLGEHRTLFCRVYKKVAARRFAFSLTE
jgi:hypothetical protein